MRGLNIKIILILFKIFVPLGSGQLPTLRRKTLSFVVSGVKSPIRLSEMWGLLRNGDNTAYRCTVRDLRDRTNMNSKSR